MAAKPKTIDAYLVKLSAVKRATLEKLRKDIQAAAPKAEECISYQLPAFRLNGRFLVAFGAATNHCAFYPAAKPILVYAEELKKYDTSKGAIRFPADKPLPAALVRKLVKLRIAENEDVAKPQAANQVEFALRWLKTHSTARDRDNLKRFAISAPKSIGVSMANMKVLAKQLGRNHELAAALWGTGWYEARMLATLVDEPEKVTPAQMERWCRDFDNWAICDTACFCLFDRTPHAWDMMAKWYKRKEEFVKRTAFALLWSLTVHDKKADDTRFIKGLNFIERAATDERNLVKKAVNMALRAVGKRNPALNAAAVAVAQGLADAEDATARWVGKDALRELTGPSVARRLSRPRQKPS